MKNVNKSKEFAIDILVDIVGNMLIAVGVYNFAANSGFPVAGISGVALIFYHLFGLPIGTMTIVLNIPIIILCYKVLGKKFLLRSLKTMLIQWPLMDFIAPMFPVYEGDRLLSAICAGVFFGTWLCDHLSSQHIYRRSGFCNHVSAGVKAASFYRKDYFRDRPCDRCDRWFDLRGY